MTTSEEFCEMLVYVAKNRPLDEWPDHRRAQFLRLVDPRQSRTLTRNEMWTLGVYLFELSRLEDPAREVQRRAHWQMKRTSREEVEV